MFEHACSCPRAPGKHSPVLRLAFPNPPPHTRELLLTEWNGGRWNISFFPLCYWTAAGLLISASGGGKHLGLLALERAQSGVKWVSSLWVCVCVYMQVCSPSTCMCRPEVYVGCLLSLCSSFWRLGLHWSWSSLFSLAWLDSKPLMSNHLCPSTHNLR